MRTEAEIQKLLDHIKADDRYAHTPGDCANVLTNGPLALIQCELTGRAQALRWVLGEHDHGGGSAGSPEVPV